MKYKIKIMGVLLLCNCLAFNENDLDPTSNPIWTLLNLAELQRLENIEFIPEIQLKLLDSSLPESEQNASIQYAFRKKQKMELPENFPAFDLDDHFFSYSQFFSSDSILRLQGLGSHTFDLYTVEASETIKIGVLEFELSINSNKDSLNFNFQPEMGMERFVIEIENVRIDSKSKQEFHYGSALISYYDGDGFYGAFTELDQDFPLDEFNGKHYLMKSDDGLQFRILEETTDFGLGYRKNSSNGRYDFSEYSQKFNDNSFSLTEDGFLSLNRFRNRSGCEDIVCFAPTLEPETVHMQEYRQGQLIHQYIPVAIEETYLLRNLLGYFQGYTFAFGTDASSLYRADNRSFRPQESDRNTFPITNFTGKNIYKKLNDENLLMGYINNSGLNLQLSIAANLSQVEEVGSPMTSLVNEGSLSGAEDFGQNDWVFFSDGSLFVLQSDHIDNTYRLVRGIGNYLGSNDINEMEEVANFSFVSEREFLNQINLEVQGIQLEDRKLIIAHSRASDGFLPFRTHVFVSQDDLNWQEVILPDLDGSQNKNYIPFLGFRAVLERNTLHVYYVINSGPPLYQRISTQDGFNWTLPKQVRFFK